ncbi:winged helix-turn-helix transcriptional regulator [Cupriavidus necator]|uniref:winged helix-turn-helix transcriptional regulator n=1 Tax=Cupriavidus necator TaxID=106590 RepID=UPI00339D6904
MVVGTLREGTLRYSELRRPGGQHFAAHVEAAVKALEQDGLVSRTMYTTIPPRVDYELTDLGRSLMEPLQMLYSGPWTPRRGSRGTAPLRSKVGRARCCPCGAVHTEVARSIKTGARHVSFGVKRVETPRPGIERFLLVALTSALAAASYTRTHAIARPSRHKSSATRDAADARQTQFLSGQTSRRSIIDGPWQFRSR